MSFGSGQEYIWQSYPNTDAIPIISEGKDLKGANFSFSLPMKKLPIEQPANEHWSMLIHEIMQSGLKTRLEMLHMIENTSQKELLDALPLLLRMISDEAEQIRVETIDLLGVLEEQVSLNVLLPALSDSSWQVRAAAVQAISARHQSFPTQIFLQLFSHEPDVTVREMIVRAFGKHVDSLPRKGLIHALVHDPEWLVREAAAWALGQCHTDMPLVALAQALHDDSDESVRAAAARSLGQSGAMEVEPHLYRALSEDMHEEVHEAVAWALQHLDEETQGMRQWGTVYHYERQAKADLSDFIASPLQDTTQKLQALQIMTQFIHDKQGCVNHNNMIQTSQGQVLIINCIYEQAGSKLQENIFPSIQNRTLIASLDTAFQEQDDMIKNTISQALKERETRNWQDLFVVSLSLNALNENKNASPLYRIIVSGMGCGQVREDDEPVINQIIDVVSETFPSVLSCQPKHFLTDLKIWHQLDTDQYVQQDVKYSA